MPGDSAGDLFGDGGNFVTFSKVFRDLQPEIGEVSLTQKSGKLCQLLHPGSFSAKTTFQNSLGIFSPFVDYSLIRSRNLFIIQNWGSFNLPENDHMTHS